MDLNGKKREELLDPLGSARTIRSHRVTKLDTGSHYFIVSAFWKWDTI